MTFGNQNNKVTEKVQQKTQEAIVDGSANNGVNAAEIFDLYEQISGKGPKIENGIHPNKKRWRSYDCTRGHVYSRMEALKEQIDFVLRIYKHVNGNILLSQEGTTRGDPPAMSMYGLALLPLMGLLGDRDYTEMVRRRRQRCGEAGRNMQALRETATT